MTQKDFENEIAQRIYNEMPTGTEFWDCQQAAKHVVQFIQEHSGEIINPS
jgi:hypothetical protein